MNDLFIVGAVIVAILVYLIVTHKIDLSKLKGDLQADLAKIHATAQATHAAALAPVSVATVQTAPPARPSDPAAVVAAAIGAPIPSAPAPVPLAAAPAGSAAANNADNPVLAAYAASGDVRGANAGGNAEALGAAAAAQPRLHRRSIAGRASSTWCSVRYATGRASPAR
jgi:hypothetical protein